ncbi:MAG: ATP phosphoribosyltransferase regulatory subunit [Lachnospiraceae bacterium]|nr:ATP phosphoribosyltransferase regulatory subunit [Lachnospiraceae bacterium]MDY4098285.1 ATP phosphoribosyltransferase regulatory subunit [Lachnospiraceae bacterium]
MKSELIHTPEGVRDIYGDEYARKLQIQSRLLERIRLFGYQDIQTPTFEFFDVFSKEIGTTPTRELYKFFDSDGNILCLRPDFTPSMARCAAKYFSEEDMPLRFTYQGNTFSNTSLLQGKLKETTQMGAELMGEPSVQADGEIISMLVDALLHTGLKDFQVSVGEVNFFKGICQELSLSGEEEENVREYISNKNFFAAKEYLEAQAKGELVAETMVQIEELFGSVEVLDKARALSQNPLCQKAIERLSGLYDVLCAYGVERYVSFDLGMLNSYHYYTGIIFKVYTYGIGDAVVKGGRYDRLLPYFGKDSAAIGFVVVIDDLMQALSRQRIPVELAPKPAVLVYQAVHYPQALEAAAKLRQKGQAVQLIPFDAQKGQKAYQEYAKKQGIEEIIFLTDDQRKELP